MRPTSPFAIALIVLFIHSVGCDGTRHSSIDRTDVVELKQALADIQSRLDSIESRIDKQASNSRVSNDGKATKSKSNGGDLAFANSPLPQPGEIGYDNPRDQPRAPMRSPFPQPGENITVPIKPTLLLKTPSPNREQPVAKGPYAWTDATKYVGQLVKINGTVVEVGKSKSGTVFYLNFVPYTANKTAFCLVIFKKDFETWPKTDLESWVGKKIEATGPISTYQSRPQMKIREPKQIKVME